MEDMANQLPFYTCVCSLWSEDGTKELQVIEGLDAKGNRIPALIGTLVSTTFHLFSPSGTETAYFIFPDLTCQVEGRFRLKFSLFDLAG